MIDVKAYGNHAPLEPIGPITIKRRLPLAQDVVIAIDYCGICHSDIHTARSEWGPTMYPCVPGHEIVGQVTKVGKSVKKFKVGDFVGVGCLVSACNKCANCKNGEQQFCVKGASFTYNSPTTDGTDHTFGGYASQITVNQDYVLRIKKGLPLAKIAPLLCAGITTYSPLKRYGTKKGTKVGVVGLGGLGHMAIKLAKAKGAEVTVFSTSPHKEQDAKKLGAKRFVLTKDPTSFQVLLGQLDLIIDTVSADHDFTPYLSTLRVGGTHVLLGAAPEPNRVGAFGLIFGRKQLAGSLIGGIKETQEMLDFCARKKVFSDIELIKPEQINDAYEKTIKGQVKYRFVVDLKSVE